LLTGMGRDGAAELKLMRDTGAITFAQDKESSVIYGMPGEAVRLDAATYVLAPDKIASALVALWNQQEHHLSNMQGRRTDARPES
jgi:two-component system, chemotaxis family, protein-glutamate methylesterase/glutaminase